MNRWKTRGPLAGALALFLLVGLSACGAGGSKTKGGAAKEALIVFDSNRMGEIEPCG